MNTPKMSKFDMFEKEGIVATSVMVNDASSKMAHTVRQADQQLRMNHFYDTLGEKLQESKELVVCGIQQASELQDTIRNLQKTLWAGTTCYVPDTHDYASKSNVDVHNRGMILCRRCGNDVPKSLYSKHFKSCFANTSSVTTNKTSQHSEIQLTKYLMNEEKGKLSSYVRSEAAKPHRNVVADDEKMTMINSSRTSTGSVHYNTGRLSVAKMETLVLSQDKETAIIARKLEKDKALHNDWCKRRHLLAYQMEKMQMHILRTIQPELSRIHHTFECGTNASIQIETSFTHGAKQMMDSNRITTELCTELDHTEKRIASWQLEIQKGDEEDQHIVDQIIASFIQLQVRRRKIMMNSLDKFARKRKQLLAAANTIHAWRIEASNHRKRCLFIDKLVALLQKVHLRDAVQRWIHNMSVLLEADARTSSMERTLTSIGDVSLHDLKLHRLQDLNYLRSILDTLSSVKMKHRLSSSMVSLFEDTSNSMLPPLSSETHLCIQKARIYYEMTECSKAAYFYREALDYIVESSDWCSKHQCFFGSNTMTLTEVICILHLYIIESYLQANKPNYVLVFIDKLLSFIENVKIEGDRGKTVLKACLSYSHEWASALAAKDLASQALLLLKSRCKEHQQSTATHTNITLYDEENVIQTIHNKLDEMTSTLYKVPKHSGIITTELPRVTANHFSLLQQKADLSIQIDEKKLTLTGFKSSWAKLLVTRANITDELQRTLMKKGKIASKLIHEHQETLIDVRELRERLQDKQHMIDTQLDELRFNEERTAKEMKNLEDEMKDVESDIDLERCGLLQAVIKKKYVRCARISMTLPESCFLLALSIDKEIYVYDMKSSKLKVAFFGDHENDHVGEIKGHLSEISCLDVSPLFAISGSLDKNIICWDLERSKLHFVARGHEATITCVRWADERIVSGSLDKTLIVWDHQGRLLSRIQGHPTAVMNIDCTTRFNISVDANGQIFVWTKDFQCTRTIRSLVRGKITVVKWGGFELACGDSKGYIDIWSVESMHSILNTKSHSSSVTDLYIDAIKCISCGYDGFIRIMDRIVGGVVFSYGTQGLPFLCLSVCSLHGTIYVVSVDWTVHQLPLYGDESTVSSSTKQSISCCASSTAEEHGWSGTSLASRILRDTLTSIT